VARRATASIQFTAQATSARTVWFSRPHSPKTRPDSDPCRHASRESGDARAVVAAGECGVITALAGSGFNRPARSPPAPTPAARRLSFCFLRISNWTLARPHRTIAVTEEI